MNIGIPREIRPFEFRVGMHPIGVQMLCKQGHTVYVEHDAGLGSGFSDLEFQDAGARIAYSAHEVFARADLLIKVARPTYEELEWMRPNTTLAGLLHLGSSRQDKVNVMQGKQISALALENITLPNGSLPVRRPLSQIGGRMAAQIGTRLLHSDQGGKGILVGGVPGVPPAEVVVIGAGVVGACAIRAFSEMGAHVTVLDTDLQALQRVTAFNPGVVTMIAYDTYIARACTFADIVVGAVLVPGETAPTVVTREMVKAMKPRAIVMDISIDEGGCVETSRPMTHEQPTFVEEGVIHYCVPNIPSIVARTSTYAYLNAAMPYIFELANKGIDQAIETNPVIESGVMIHKGDVRQSYHTSS